MAQFFSVFSERNGEGNDLIMMFTFRICYVAIQQNVGASTTTFQHLAIFVKENK